jgi:hypothetical protein
VLVADGGEAGRPVQPTAGSSHLPLACGGPGAGDRVGGPSERGQDMSVESIRLQKEPSPAKNATVRFQTVSSGRVGEAHPWLTCWERAGDDVVGWASPPQCAAGWRAAQESRVLPLWLVGWEGSPLLRFSSGVRKGLTLPLLGACVSPDGGTASGGWVECVWPLTGRGQ